MNSESEFRKQRLKEVGDQELTIRFALNFDIRYFWS